MGGIDAAPVTWVGSDKGAAQFTAACEASNLSIQGIEASEEMATPTCFLIYQPDGSYGCLFQPGPSHPRELTGRQRKLIEAADLVLIAVGPPELSDEILRLIREDAVVAWIAKTDHTAYPLQVRERYAARADYIFCNSGERSFVNASFGRPRTSRQAIIETHGKDGVLIDTLDHEFSVSVDPVQTSDTTGAGDTLAGATMACILAGACDLRSAVETGIRRSGELLEGRNVAAAVPGEIS
jgi:ribokinase